MLKRWALAKFSRQPVLFKWNWTDSEWAEIVTELKVPFPTIRAFLYCLAIPAGVLIWRCLNMWWHARLAELNIVNELTGFLVIGGLCLLIPLVGYWTRAYGHLVPAIEDEPVCIVTPAGIRLGNEVIWFRFRKRFFVRIEAVSDSILGPAVVITSRYPMEHGEPMEVPMILPVPKSEPGLAGSVAKTLGVTLGVSTIAGAT